MANLPENIRYNTQGTRSSIADFSGLIKNIQQKTGEQTNRTFQKSLTSRFDPEAAARIFTPAKARYVPKEETGMFPVGQPIETPQEKYTPIPEYTQFVEPDKRDLWTLPTQEARMRTWPEHFGGGQYAVDPTQPGALIKSQRVLVSPEIRKSLLGNRPSSMFQIDHIVPLWAGGADTPANLNVLDNTTHNKKTAIQSVALTLLANKKISLNRAKFLALTWQDKDAAGLPPVNEYGYIPINVAEQYVKKWKEDSKKIETGKYFKEAFREEMGKFGVGWLPMPVREFGKGLVGGGTAGIIPGTEALEDTGLIGKTSNFAGNLVGMLTGLGILGRGLKTVGWIGAAKARIPFFKKGVETIKAVKTTRKAVEAKQGVDRVVSVANKAFKSIGLDYGNIKSVTKFTNLRKHIQDTSVLLGLYGQIGLLGRELTGPEEVDLGNHIKQAGIDIMFGTLLGGVSSLAKGGQTLGGYATIGGGVTTLSMIMGNDLEDAVKEGVLMSALHGMGAIRNPKMIRNLGFETKLSTEATKQATTILNTYSPKNFPIYKRGVVIPEVLKYKPEQLNHMEKTRQSVIKQNPDDIYFNQLGPINTTEKATYFGELVARRELSNTVAKAEKAGETISDEMITKELTTITAATNFLRNKTLPTKQQQMIKTRKDIRSLGQSLLPQLQSGQLRFLERTDVKLNRLPTEIISREAVPLKYIERYKQTESIKTGETTVRGLGNDPKTGKPIDPTIQKNANYYSKNENLFDGKYYITSPSEQSKRIGEMVNREQLMAGKEAPITDIDNIANVYVRQIKNVKPGEKSFLQVGKLPQEKSFDLTYKYHVNIPFDKMMKRFRSHIKQAKDVESLSKDFNNDLAFKGSEIRPENAKRLFDSKAEISKMNDEQLLSIINAPNALSRLTVSDAIVIPKMKELGLDVFVGDIKSSTPIGVGENPLAPNIILSVTNDNFIRSMAMKDVTPKIVPKTAIPETPVLKPELKPIEVEPVVSQVSKIITPKEVKEVKIPGIKPKKEGEVIKKPKIVKKPQQNLITDLMNRNLLTQKEAAPYIVKEKRIQKLTKEVKERFLTEVEKTEIQNLTKDLRTFLKDKKLIRDPQKQISYSTQYNIIKKRNKATLTNEAIEKAEIFMDEVKGKKLTKDPTTYKNALTDSVGGARMTIINNRLKLSSAEQRNLLKEFNQKIENMVQTRTDNVFENTTDLLGRKYSTKHHQYVGFDPTTGKETPIKMQPKTLLRETSDQALAKTYGLALKEDGYLKLQFGKPTFSEQFRIQYNIKKDITPFDFWGSMFKKEFEANTTFKTKYAKEYMESLDAAEKLTGTHSLFAKTTKKMFQDIIVKSLPKKSFLRKQLEKNLGSSYTFNTLMRPDGFYAQKLSGSINKQGHYLSQPTERVIAQVEGKTIKEIETIDKQTISKEERAKEEKLKRDAKEKGISQEQILTEQVSVEDIAGMRARDDFQADKIQDLTYFEMRFPSLLYKETTGKTPPKSAIVEDAIRNFKDFVANYNASLKPGSKTPKIVVNNEGTFIHNKITKQLDKKAEGWNHIREIMLKNRQDIPPVQKQILKTKIESPKTFTPIKDIPEKTQIDTISKFAKEQKWEKTQLKDKLTRFKKDEYTIDIWDTKNGLTVGAYHVKDKQKFFKNVSKEDVIETLIDPAYLNKQMIKKETASLF